MCINNIHASIVSKIPCYVCSLKACGYQLETASLQFAAGKPPQVMENGGWEVGKAEFLVIMQGNQLSNQSKSPSHMPVRNF